MNNYTDEEICEALRYGEESELMGIVSLAANRIEELTKEVEILNNELINESYNNSNNSNLILNRRYKLIMSSSKDGLKAVQELDRYPENLRGADMYTDIGMNKND